MQGTCGPIQIHGVNVPSNKFRNNPPYCKKRSTTCLAAAGGIGNINTPYYRTPAPGEKGCGCKFGSCDGGFVLKAGSNPFESKIAGFVAPSFVSLEPDASAFGSLKGEDASPIENKDILYFLTAGSEPGERGYGVALKPTPEVKKYLASRFLSWSFITASVYNIILNINGKEYPRCQGDEVGDGPVLLSFFPPGPVPPTSSVPQLKQGETYNFSFK